MNRILPFLALSLTIFLGWTFAYGQAGDEKIADQDRQAYRVMSIAEMFEGDEEAQKKISQMTMKVTIDGVPQGLNRTDMDAVDYERALNRLAADGWILVAANQSNYWVFKKQPE